MIIKRLHDHIVGECDLSATQVRSAEVLLRKSIPDLSAVATAPADTEEGRQILGWEDDGSDEDTVQASPAVPPVPQQE